MGTYIRWGVTKFHIDTKTFSGWIATKTFHFPLALIPRKFSKTPPSTLYELCSVWQIIWQGNAPISPVLSVCWGLWPSRHLPVMMIQTTMHSSSEKTMRNLTYSFAPIWKSLLWLSIFLFVVVQCWFVEVYVILRNRSDRRAWSSIIRNAFTPSSRFLSRGLFTTKSDSKKWI